MPPRSPPMSAVRLPIPPSLYASANHSHPTHPTRALSRLEYDLNMNQSARKKQAKSVLLHFRGHEARKAKKAKEEQLALRRGASKVAREVRAFWGKLNKVRVLFACCVSYYCSNTTLCSWSFDWWLDGWIGYYYLFHFLRPYM